MLLFETLWMFICRSSLLWWQISGDIGGIRSAVYFFCNPILCNHMNEEEYCTRMLFYSFMSTCTVNEYWTVQRVFLKSITLYRYFGIGSCTALAIAHPTVYDFTNTTSSSIQHVIFSLIFVIYFYLFIFIDMSRECSHRQPQTSFQRLIPHLGKIMEQYTGRIPLLS